MFKGAGSALTTRVLANEELARMVDTSDEWIRERTGIASRRYHSMSKDGSCVFCLPFPLRAIPALFDISAYPSCLLHLARVSRP